MYHSNGNYEAFARPQKPAGVDGKSAYIVGSGLAGLAAAAFLVRDAQMPGERIHFFEELDVAGGSMDGIFDRHKGFVIRGGREMEAHFETLWDLFRSIPSLQTEGISVLDEFYWLNKQDPSLSKTRLIHRRGQRIPTDGQLLLSRKAIQEVLHLCLTREQDLQDTRIDEVFTQEFFDSNFWTYWATMFAFEPWASAMEMRRYLMRFVHHISTLSDMSALKFTQYNQYESLILPLTRYLQSHGVTIQYRTQVTDVVVQQIDGTAVATGLVLQVDGQEQTLELTQDDLVFVTNGSITESTSFGDNDTPAPICRDLGSSWKLWKRLAAQHPAFGRPEKFCDNIPEANWVISATVTLTDDRVLPYLERITKVDPHSGSLVTSGPVNVTDSNWLYGFSISRQPHFAAQPDQDVIVWLYGLFSDRPGNHITKPITECTGSELCQEWLYHLGVPEEEILDIATNSARTIPCSMPYITSYFMPRALGDRPKVVPDGSKNLAFLGNFAETERDTVFTTEYSVRTAMEAVYTLLEVDRGVPEVFASSFDVRMLLRTVYYLNDRKDLNEIELPWLSSLAEKWGLKHLKGTYIEELLHEANLT
ncbi:oleate hydratase [Nakamurella leprariae]|uniref:Oleate hydratase n=1 Tax=Nakamurella leprariae TaxID=2803911 RepID=A0A938Y4P7_9ACTN|nr:oleate hydratase [Nakamurella leprariae]MBM9465690.1 oleate hydratase [Nakamurella leprariae]